MHTKTSKHRLRAALVASLAIATGATITAAGPGNAAPITTPRAANTAVHALAASSTRTATSGTAGASAVPLKLPSPVQSKPTLVQPTVYDDCATARAQAIVPGKIVTCITMTRATAPTSTNPGAGAQAPARPGTHAVTPAAVPALCANQFDVWVINRTNQCIQGMNITATAYLLTDPVGTDTFRIDQNIVLNTYNNFFTENDTITRTGATGRNATDAVGVTFTPSCTSPCQPGNGAGTTAFTLTLPNTPGAQRSLAYSFLDNPAMGTQNRAATSYQWLFKLVDPDFKTPASISYSAGEAARCDNTLPGRSPGCVYTSFGPVLTLPVSTYGAAAMNVFAGESYLSGHPGLSSATPLTRGNPAVTDGNRDAICDGTFYTSLLLVPNDSCDEYPFASSQQSGGAHNLTGADCLELLALQDPNGGSWRFYQVTSFVTPRQCLRGHVPGPQNSAVGTALGQMYTLNRMITGDPYLVGVTA